MKTFWITLTLALSIAFRTGSVWSAESLPGTQPLTTEGDITSQLVSGVDTFLLREIDESVERRGRFWHRDFSSPEAYSQSIETHRARLAHLLGVRDRRASNTTPELVATVDEPALVGIGVGYEIYAIRWAAFGDVHGEGLLLKPTGRAAVGDVIAVPDAEQTPEQLVGLSPGIPAESQFARRFAESGCRVVVPTLINRSYGPHKGRAKLPAREFLYRSAFELGRGVIAYEVEKLQALVDWMAREADNQTPGRPPRIALFGWGEGGLLSLYTGALDSRIHTVAVSGYFDDRKHLWEEPIDRNVFGLFEQFGDAELASLIAPRTLLIESARGPEMSLTGKGGGAPSRVITPKQADVEREILRAKRLTSRLSPSPLLEAVYSDAGAGPFGSEIAMKRMLTHIAPGTLLAALGTEPKDRRLHFDPAARQLRQFHELDQHNQFLLTESPLVRREFMKNLDTTSLEAFEKSVEPYRRYFSEEVVGHFDRQPLAPNARSRKAYDEPLWTGYEVVMDVFPDVIAYGILLVPKNLKEGERRPVVVCQHGLEGRPQDIVKGNHEAYHDFAAKLAERGFITFAPQNLYIFTDRFRSIQRKSYPLKKTLFSIIVPQHQQIVDWLGTLPFVDADRIGFYGLSYGGKSAMRIPPLVPQYKLSICSADFNEWVGKNAATAGTMGTYSYAYSGEYEIFEFDLGSTFNYAEMATLIAPRPFMVERGHFDGVAPDEAVAWEFGKVRNFYAAKLKLGERCEMETFVGPHTIHGQGTFDFLHKHLEWPKAP